MNARSRPAFRFFAALSATSCLGASLLAHGGQYRGPGNAVPPSPGSASSSSGGNSGGSSGGGNGGSGSTTAGSSTAPSSAAPASGPAASTATVGRGARGMQVADDLTAWEFWWEFRKDPFLDLREHQRRRAPTTGDDLTAAAPASARSLQALTDDDVRQVALPALEKALRAADDRDTITGCMVAMAKIGRDLPTLDLHEVLRERLRSRDQEVRETAALCFGIARRAAPKDTELLLALAGDEAAGRSACDRAAVDERTRSFSTYALGLLLSVEKDLGARHRIVNRATALLEAPTGVDRNLKVAAIGALSQLRGTTAADQVLREGAITKLLDYYLKDLGPGEQLVQAHCPPAFARMVDRDEPLAQKGRDLFAADLRATLGEASADRRPARNNHHVAQSCALALGMLCRPWDDVNAPDLAIVQLLLQCWRQHKDQQTRNFAILALGRIGGEQARQVLLDELERGSKAVQKPWTAIALGALVGNRLVAAKAMGRTLDPDPVIGKALLAVLDDVKNPSTLGAIAIAIGICQYRDAADELQRLLRDHSTQDEVAGQLAVALSLLDADRARKDLRELLPRSVRRPQLLVQLAVALGRMGESEVVLDLLGMLGETEGGLARLSAIANALGQIGDRRSLRPLCALLGDQDATALTRAFAAVAIGGVCDKDTLPWNACFADSLNYRAAVETLTDGAAGILDIL